MDYNNLYSGIGNTESILNSLPFDFYTKINLKVNDEISKAFEKLINVSNDEIWRICYKFIDETGIYKPDTFFLQLTKLNSLVLKGEVNGESIYLEIIFSKETCQITQVGLNIFHYQDQKLSDFGSEEKIFLELKQYLSPYKPTSINNSQTFYELSPGYHTAA